jgi:hypothetical protein
VRKLVEYLASNTDRVVRIGRERLRQLLHERAISFQRTRTWKESTDPDKDTKLDRIEHVTTRFPDRCFAFDQFGPASIRPTHGIRYFHGCYAVGDDQLWGVVRARKGADHTGRAEIDPGRPPRRRPDLRHLGQPVGEQDLDCG